MAAASEAISASAEPFPEPPELKADIDFWLAIFTVYGNDEGVLHDNRNLAVVYERVAMPESLSRRERQRRSEKSRTKIQATLRILATGKRDKLTDEEARVLALWPADVSNKSLRVAVGRIRFQQGLKDRFQEGLRRSGRWRSFVDHEFRALGVPVEIAALPHVESSYDLTARSHVGASGIWQFTRSTGRRFMRVDHVVDERNDPFAATRAAARLMAYNFSLTGNWPMAITAYNHGLAGARRAMRQFGDTAYVDILRNYKGRTFGFASRNFYVAFLAAKQVDQNVQQYFPGLVAEQPTEYSVLRLTRYLSASGLANALGIAPAVLAKHNPALQATVWQGSKYLPKDYELRLPTSTTTKSLADVVAGLPDDAVFDRQLPDMFHRVSRGDTLSQIANTYATNVATLVALNNLNSSHRIRAGEQLRLPAAGPIPQEESDVPAVASAPVAVTTVSGAVGANAIAEADVQETEVQEMTPIAMAGNDDSASVGSVQTALLSDPNDYSVSTDGTIEVYTLETLGHYGDWLAIKTQRLRDLNGLAFRTAVVAGQRIKLDLNTVDAKTFEERRIAYHRIQQDRFFQRHSISGVTEHTIRAGESIWIVALRRYKVPVWLFRQYNPTVDVQHVRPGTKIQIPLIRVTGGE